MEVDASAARASILRNVLLRPAARPLRLRSVSLEVQYKPYDAAPVILLCEEGASGLYCGKMVSGVLRSQGNGDEFL